MPGYTAEIKGYDVLNTYHPAPRRSRLTPAEPDESNVRPAHRPAVTDSPKTGDNSHLTIWVVLLFLSLAGLIMTPLLRKRKSRECRSKRH